MGQQTIIAIEKADLDGILRELADLKSRLDKVILTPKPEWVSVREYAASIGRSERTVQRHIDQGRLVTKEECGVTLVKTSG